MVWVCFLPLFLSLRYFQRRLSAAYGVVRRQVGDMLAAVSEPVVGAAVVRSLRDRGAHPGAHRRRDRRATRRPAPRAQGLTAFSFSLGGVSAGLANAGVLIVGVLLGVDGEITAGKVLAFAFLVTLFVGPVQIGTQVLTDAQNAIAGWRRVIGILDTPADVVDPGRATGTRAAARAARRRLRGRRLRLPRRPAGAARRRPARSRPAPGSRSSARPARARPRSPSC